MVVSLTITDIIQLLITQILFIDTASVYSIEVSNFLNYSFFVVYVTALFISKLVRENYVMKNRILCSKI